MGLIRFEMANVPADQETLVTIPLEIGHGFNSYHKFGPTSKGSPPMYYRFLYGGPGTTGAEILADRIILHLRDGQLGDDDLTVNGKIVDPGGPVVNNSVFPYQNPLLRLDVNDDGAVAPIDAFQVITFLNDRIGASEGEATAPVQNSAFTNAPANDLPCSDLGTRVEDEADAFSRGSRQIAAMFSGSARVESPASHSNQDIRKEERNESELAEAIDAFFRDLAADNDDSDWWLRPFAIGVSTLGRTFRAIFCARTGILAFKDDVPPIVV